MVRALRLGAAGVSFVLPLLQPSDASACGGCFHPENQPVEESSVVLAHRMALSISTEASVLWDQVEYTGSPSEFAWVLPVRPGARIEVASDAWFEALDAATSVRVRAPTIQCVTRVQEEGFYEYDYGGRNMRCQAAPGREARIAVPAAALGGCSSEEVGGDPVWVEGREITEISEVAPPEEPVSVVHRGSAGPYETVTLHANVEGALVSWLTERGYAIDPEIQPIIDSYVDEGFDFIALRLLPDVGVQQMKPVRVIQPGAVATLPLRMVAAGTGANVSLTLFVIAEGRYEAANFENALRPDFLTWDFSSQSSTYASDRQSLLGGQARWMSSYAQPGALLAPAFDPMSGVPVQYTTGLGAAGTIADAYMDQALANGEAELSCAGIFNELAGSTDRVVDPCPPEGDTCGEVGPGELDARYFACGPVKDLQVALTGLHPADVWVTRLEAELPRQALASDLELWPALQDPINNLLQAADFTNPPCEVSALGATPPSSQARGGGGGGGRGAGGGPRGFFLVAGGALALITLARRSRRWRKAGAVSA